MLLLDIAAIIAMMLLGTYCSFTDCKKGIVSNMAVKTGLGVAIALLVMRTVIGGTGQLASCAANVSITCLFSIALYATHTWAGGDCKPPKMPSQPENGSGHGPSVWVFPIISYFFAAVNPGT